MEKSDEFNNDCIGDAIQTNIANMPLKKKVVRIFGRKILEDYLAHRKSLGWETRCIHINPGNLVIIKTDGLAVDAIMGNSKC